MPTGTMKVLLLGATGMVGQVVLRECLLDSGVVSVTVVGRSPVGLDHPKLVEVLHADLSDLQPIVSKLKGHDACFFCLGVSSVGMTEAAYREKTYDLTLAAARVLAKSDPDMSFSYVSGAGTDSTEVRSTMWARVKGKTENDLLKVGFSRVFLFRPGVIQPLHGVRTKTSLYRLIYAVSGPVISMVKRWMPDRVVTSEEFGRAMLATARNLKASAVLEVKDIVKWGAVDRASPPARDNNERMDGNVKIRISVEGKSAVAALADSTAARDFLSMLPLTLTLKDYSRTEKISNLPRKLSIEGAPAGYKPCAGDISFYAPWGNLAVFYRDFRYSDGFVKLGRIYSGMDVLDSSDPITATIEQIRP